jgi:GR25 family glycosyltransferase involved in LPS biosynthesis
METKQCLDQKGLVLPKITNVVVLNLKESHQRREHMQAMLQQKNWPFKILQTDRPSNRRSQAFSYRDGWALLEGELGCWYAHQLAWQRALESEHEFTMVLEDDIQFPEKHGYINWAMAVPRDAHIIALNTLVDFTRGHPMTTVATTSSKNIPACSGVTTVVRYLAGRSLLGYVVTRAGAAFLLNITAQPAFNYPEPIDTWLYSKSQPAGLNTYVALALPVQTINKLNDFSTVNCEDWIDGEGCA